MKNVQRRAALFAGVCALALVAGVNARVGRRRRPELLASRNVRQPRRGPRHAGLVLGADLSASRPAGGGGANFVTTNGIPGSVVAGLSAKADALVEGVTYTFASPVFGGQAGISLLAAPGSIGVGVNASLTGPLGNTIAGSKFDNRFTVSDVFYQGTLKWNQGVHNEMIYVAGNIPSGTYDSTRLANLSFGFTAVDFGAGYTYLNPHTGHEFSVVGGVTYTGPNNALQYQNGIDAHIDWAASQFISKSVHVGIAGYYFQQLTGDSGLGARLGDFKGMAVGIGPQIGFMFPVGDMAGYLNIKGYADLETENRPKGYSTWVSFVLSPKAPEAPPTAKTDHAEVLSEVERVPSMALRVDLPGADLYSMARSTQGQPPRGWGRLWELSDFSDWGHVAEWLRNGLQNRVHQFNSGRGLHSQAPDFSAQIIPRPRAAFPAQAEAVTPDSSGGRRLTTGSARLAQTSLRGGREWRNLIQGAHVGEIVRFIPKSELERARLIREARAIYDGIFPPGYALPEPVGPGASASRRVRRGFEQADIETGREPSCQFEQGACALGRRRTSRPGTAAAARRLRCRWRHRSGASNFHERGTNSSSTQRGSSITANRTASSIKLNSASLITPSAHLGWRNVAKPACFPIERIVRILSIRAIGARLVSDF